MDTLYISTVQVILKDCQFSGISDSHGISPFAGLLINSINCFAHFCLRLKGEAIVRIKHFKAKKLQTLKLLIREGLKDTNVNRVCHAMNNGAQLVNTSYELRYNYSIQIRNRYHVSNSNLLILLSLKTQRNKSFWKLEFSASNRFVWWTIIAKLGIIVSLWIHYNLYILGENICIANSPSKRVNL